MSTATKRFVVIFAVLALLVGACGDDDDTAGEEAGPVTDQDGDGGGAGDDDGSGEEPVAITVRVMASTLRLRWLVGSSR